MSDVDLMLDELFGKEEPKEEPKTKPREVYKEGPEVDLDKWLEEEDVGEKEPKTTEKTNDDDFELPEDFLKDLEDSPEIFESEPEDPVQEIPEELPTDAEINEPQNTEKEQPEVEFYNTKLELFEGETLNIPNVIVNKPVPADRNIVRKTDKGYELIAIAPVKVISCSDTEAQVLITDHILRTQELSAEDTSAMLRFEKEHEDVVKNLFNMSVAELYEVSEDDLMDIMVPEEVKAMLTKIEAELNIKVEPTPELAKATSEVEILKILLKEKSQ